MPIADRTRGRVQTALRVASRELLLATVVVAAIGGATALLLVAVGFPVGPGLAALWTGAFGSWYAFTSATLVRAVPLLLTGCAVALAFRGGVLNIGGEGQLLVGAAAAAAVALAVPAVGGLALSRWWRTPGGGGRRRDLGGGGGLSPRPLRRARGDQHDHAEFRRPVRGVVPRPRAAAGADPRVSAECCASPRRSTSPRIPGAGRLHAGLVLALVLALAAGWMLRYTAAGFRLVATGESPTAAASAGGIDVRATTARVFLLSGALAGLAGGD